MGKRVLTVAIVLLAFVSAGTAHATFPGANGRIAFVSDRDGNFEIYTMNPDGSEQTRLTTSEGIERNPSWSPEGRRIAYDRHSYIYVLADDGSYDVRIDNCFYDSQPSWSPDGTRHVLYRQFGKTPYLLTRDVDGTDEDRLEGPAVTIGAPEWSPDGISIALENQVFGIDDKSYSGIWVMDADGSNAHEVTDSTNNDQDPSWHPSSERIVFASDRDGQLEIYSIGVDGNDLVRLTNNQASDFDPAWSPDGTEIAFISNRSGGHEVWVMNADGTNVRRLTDNDAREADVDWAPASTAELPVAPHVPPADCIDEEIERTITLELDEHLRARGRYTEQGGDESRCAFDLRVQRETDRGWRNVLDTWTLEGSRYRARIPDKEGRYRAKLRRGEFGFYTDRYRDVCGAAVSDVVVHRH